MKQVSVQTDALYVEFDSERQIRYRNKLHYRFNHWPIWIFVFFIAPGPLTFDLFESGFDSRLLTWLANVGSRSLGGLRAGQWVTTGSCTGTILVAPGTTVVAEFPCLGRAELRLA